MTVLGTVGDYQVGLWVASLVADGPFYASLHTSDPRVGDPTASEVTDADYVRQEFTFAALGARAANNVEQLEWENVDPITVSHVGVFAGPTDANLCFVYVPATEILVAAGKNYVVASGDLYVAW